MERVRLIAVAYVTLIVLALAVTGCAVEADRDEAASNPLVGDWVDLAGSTIRFTGDVYYTSAADESRPHYRYRIVSQSKLALTPIIIENGLEVDDAQNMRVEPYAIEGDTLRFGPGSAVYYRPGSSDFEEASAQRDSTLKTQAAGAEQAMQLRACLVIRSISTNAFHAWFDRSHPDRSGHGYTIGQYMKYRRVRIGWDFPEFRKRIGAGYDEAVRVYEEAEMPEEYVSTPGFVEWIRAGVCPSGGTYTLRWNTDAQVNPQIGCSVHGAAP